VTRPAAYPRKPARGAVSFSDPRVERVATRGAGYSTPGSRLVTAGGSPVVVENHPFLAPLAHRPDE